MSRGALILWVIVPYVCLTTFVLGHVWRYRRDQFGWTTRSTQLLERDLLRWGSWLFHFGLLAAIGGHVLGLLVPKSWTDGVGVSEDAYHVISVSAGSAAGLAMLAGLAILLYRRARVPRVAATTTRMDVLTLVVLALAVGTGVYATSVFNLFMHGEFDYRETVAPWFRQLFVLDPDGSLLTGIPLVYQLHVLSTLALFAIWPFGRLVHAWSVPIVYIARRPILYRRRVPRPSPRRGVPVATGASDSHVRR